MTRRAYESEFTRFINTHVSEHPEILDAQRIGWAIHWDRIVDPQDVGAVGEAEVPAEEYFYYGWRAAPPEAR